ncbi:MAG: uroporphyrinogen-III C-methyltransferase [Chloroflexota bacterium]|nr:uroporphyrinogen-III C-methyltransferase [Chloroflexota bacterium]MDE2941000.1 uroporphyrinogen-III C-methyltransferase [Chloroflexota bacterium]MDE3268233.1 uroporphyrinogen-III C-methyltransferase [Chloroflexota bacterium]
MREPGVAYLVGAGPGDPGLITARGLALLRSAQVVVYDRLVNRSLLDEAPAQAELVDAGKARGDRRMSQEDINRLLVDRAREGLRVVRLKGGDPFVFGRGGEEAEWLAEAGVPFEVVPGVSSAIAAPAYAGIPVTHRRLSSQVTIVSGSEDPAKPESAVDWEQLARTRGTLVVMMGWETLPAIVEALRTHGMADSTPAALVEWGTEPSQRTVAGTLADIVCQGQEAGLAPPVVAVFGEVAALRDHIGWFEDRPLYGRRVLVPRTRAQAGALSQLLRERGAQPLEIPTIEIQPVEDNERLDQALRSLDTYAWVVFVSVNGVREAFCRLERLGLDARAFRGARVCAVGSATAAALRDHGIVADLQPRESVSESIVDGLSEAGVDGARVLLLRAEAGREALSDGLERAGALVDDVAVYRTVVPEGSRERVRDLLSGDGVDAVAFTSSSTLTNLLSLLDGDISALDGAAVACIGPVTAATARAAGLHVDVVASESTVTALTNALVDHFSPQGRGRTEGA